MLANLWVLLNAISEILAEQIPRQLQHERKLLAEPQAGDFREDLCRYGR